MPALQGFIVEWPFATPMIGFSKSPSWKPTARNIARLGERATPAVMICERRLSFVTSTSLLDPAPQGSRGNQNSALRSVQDLDSAGGQHCHWRWGLCLRALGRIRIPTPGAKAGAVVASVGLWDCYHIQSG